MKWKKAFGAGLECIPLELAGRGIRAKDPFYTGMRDASEDVLDQLMRHYDGSPYALFGHSMGGMILYETALLLRDRNMPAPARLFISGRPTPETINSAEPIHLLSDDEFAERIIEMGATSPEIFASKPLKDAFMPILRADFRLVETYRYEEKEPLALGLTVIAGEEEKWTEQELVGWKRHTKDECRVVRMPGDHFYWCDKPESLIGLLKDELTKISGETKFA